MTKTKDALAVLASLGAMDDVTRCTDSKQIRTGKGKMRNRRYTMRRGPLVIYGDNSELVKAFRNIAGVECASVDRLNLLQLAPGGHVGRFCIWTESAFKKLDKIFGTQDKKSEVKHGFQVPKHTMTNADLARIINSDEIQSVLNAKKEGKRVPKLKKNPLKNFGVMMRLNPYAMQQKRIAQAEAADKAGRKARIAAKRKRYSKERSRAFAASMMTE